MPVMVVTINPENIFKVRKFKNNGRHNGWRGAVVCGTRLPHPSIIQIAQIRFAYFLCEETSGNRENLHNVAKIHCSFGN